MEQSVKDIVSKVCNFQGVRMADYGQGEHALAVLSSKTLEAVMVRVSHQAVSRFLLGRPLAHEVVDVLQAHNLHYYCPIFAQHKLSSLGHLALLTKGMVETLATDGTVVTGHTQLAEMVKLRSCIRHCFWNIGSGTNATTFRQILR